MSPVADRLDGWLRAWAGGAGSVPGATNRAVDLGAKTMPCHGCCREAGEATSQGMNQSARPLRQEPNLGSPGPLQASVHP